MESEVVGTLSVRLPLPIAKLRVPPVRFPLVSV
jgi:hypothetical protein